ncbi:MAG: hypothetical protein RLZZ517_610 [Candidatus Parcubacteria bacterium]
MGKNEEILILLGNDETRRLTCVNKFESDVLNIVGKWYASYQEIERLYSVAGLSIVMQKYVDFVYDL